VPLIILSSTGIDSFKRAVSQGTSESLLHEEIDGKRRLYTALAESVPRGEVRLVDDVGHVTLHLRRPDAVLQASRTSSVITQGPLYATQPVLEVPLCSVVSAQCRGGGHRQRLAATGAPATLTPPA
jgi:hypothetical protein